MTDSKLKIYLDFAATTPVDGDVFEKMKPYFLEKYGNPASIHSFGQEAQSAVESARNCVADFLNCSAGEVIFTSGATESNNLAIKGVVKAHFLRFPNQKSHLIVSCIEHHCILDSCKSLERDGLAEVTYLSVDKNGLIKLDELDSAIKENTILASVMYANNEVGAIQPIKQIGDMLKDLNIKRQSSKILLHTDATQAINYLNCDVIGLGVDLLSLSGHKIYGPKGVGALFIKKGANITRMQDGGGQEYNLRAGTLNVPGIVGLGEAITQIKSQESKIKIIEKLRNKLVNGVLDAIPDSFLNGSLNSNLPHIANIMLSGAEGEAVLIALDLEGIAVSTASACASRSLKPSHVLTAMGLAGFEAHCSIRFSLGKQTTEAEIDKVLMVLPPIVEKIRKIGGAISKKEQQRLPDDFGC